MESTNRQPKEAGTIEDAVKRIYKFFEYLRLFDYIPAGESNLQIAILGAGFALEVPSLKNYFTAQGKNIAQVTAVDLDLEGGGKLFTETIAASIGVPLEYRIADVGNPVSLGEELYDLVIVRNPDVHRSETNWQLIFANGFNHLKEGGIFLVTTTGSLDHRFVLAELSQRGRILLDAKIPEQLRGGGYFNDANVVIAQKERV